MNNKYQLFRTVLSIFFYLNFLSFSFGQGDKTIEPKKLIKDFENFEKFLRVHPDPYTHIPEEQFKKQLKAVKASLKKPHTHLEFYKKLALMVALIKDGHSSVYLPENWMEKKRKEFGCFPYEMHLSNSNELFVLKNFSDGEMKPGTKITSIGGISVDAFLEKIDPYISYEKLRFRNTRIDDNFEKYLYIAFGSIENPSMEYIQSDTLTTVVQNMPYKDWKKFQKDDKEERDRLISLGRPYAYEKVKDGIGKLSIYGFSAPDIKTYNQFLLKTFKTIKKDSIHSLIIDIRGNYGGWPKIASELFHYTSESYFKTMAKSNMKVSVPYRNYFYVRYPFLRTSGAAIPKQRHFVDIGSVVNGEIGSYIEEEAFFNEEPITESFEFEGDVFLLINRDSYSAASSFASTFQCYNMGFIIGEETGGTKIFRANPIAERYLYSGVGVRMSTTKLNTACFNEELEGVKPTIKYTPTIFDRLSDIDTQMIYTERVIKKVQKKRQKAMETGQ